MNKNITFVVPLRGRDEMRKPFEENVEKYFSKNGYEIIYVIQDDDKPFMVALLRNIGFYYANTDYIAYRDIDVLDLTYFDYVKEYEILNGPYRTYSKRLHIIIDNDGSYKYKDREHLVLGFGGYCIFTKQDWLNKNGFTNLCIGWGYEDNATKERYNLKTLDRTFGHIWHASNETYNDYNTKINQEIYNLYFNKKIDPILDGYLQMVYTVNSDKYISNNIREIKVKNIGVKSNFTYIDLYKKHTGTFIQNE